ncbi:MAG: 4Fe-4S binding protein [Thermoleophilia bacterium]
MYSRLFRVDAGRCTSCGACVRRCPSGNVTLSFSGVPTWGRACLFCLYCQMVCTEEAISSPVTWLPFDALVAYNVRKAAADPSLDRARVVHEGGRTRIL